MQQNGFEKCFSCTPVCRQKLSYCPQVQAADSPILSKCSTISDPFGRSKFMRSHHRRPPRLSVRHTRLFMRKQSRYLKKNTHPETEMRRVAPRVVLDIDCPSCWASGPCTVFLAPTASLSKWWRVSNGTFRPRPVRQVTMDFVYLLFTKLSLSLVFFNISIPLH